MPGNSALPHLLDKYSPQEQTPRFLGKLNDLRHQAFSLWADPDAISERGAAPETATDELIALALAMEYLRARGHGGAERFWRDAHRIEHASPSGLAAFAASVVRDRGLRECLLRNVCRTEAAVPAAVSERIFNSGLQELLAELNGLLPITALGDFHQLCLADPLVDGGMEINQRRIKGAHYTPPPLVDYMVTRAMPGVLSDLTERTSLRVLDPSCGCGAFLIAVQRYLTSGSSVGPLAAVKGATRFCLYGSDIDSRAVVLARLGLALASECVEAQGARPAGRHISPNLLVQDFLADTAWQGQTFDLIIGGPPFVRVEQLHRSNAKKVQEYRRLYETAQTGQFDLYMPFIEKSIGLLTPRGLLSFSVSSSFLRSKSGSRLRSLISQTCHVEELIEFEDSRLYPDASVQIALIALRRGAEGSTRYVFVPKQTDVRRQMASLVRPSGQPVSEKDELCIDLRSQTDGTWSLRSARDQQFVDHVDTVGTPLGKLPVDICLGVCTGADAVFILKRRGSSTNGIVSLKTRAGDAVDVEAGILRPILRARRPSEALSSALPYACIFPYDRGRLPLTEARLRAIYPRAYSYLKSHQARLQSRRLCPGQPWFALRKVDIRRLLSKPKIITPSFFSRGGFCLDNQGILCHHGILCIAPLDGALNVYYLLGVLNSSVIWRYISLAGAPAGGARRILRLGLARRLPVVLAKTQEQNELASRIAGLMRELISGRSRSLKCSSSDVLDGLVQDLYGICT